MKPCLKRDCLLSLVFDRLQAIKTWTQGRLPFTSDVCVTVTTAKQEAELEEFKSALAALYSDIQGAPL